MIIVIITRNRVFRGSKKKNPIGIGFLIHDFIQFHVSCIQVTPQEYG